MWCEMTCYSFLIWKTAFLQFDLTIPQKTLSLQWQVKEVLGIMIIVAAIVWIFLLCWIICCRNKLCMCFFRNKKVTGNHLMGSKWRNFETGKLILNNSFSLFQAIFVAVVLVIFRLHSLTSMLNLLCIV